MPYLFIQHTKEGPHLFILGLTADVVCQGKLGLEVVRSVLVRWECVKPGEECRVENAENHRILIPKSKEFRIIKRLFRSGCQTE